MVQLFFYMNGRQGAVLALLSQNAPYDISDALYSKFILL